MLQPAGQSNKDFQTLHGSGQAVGVSLSVGRSVGLLRDRIARVLLRVGMTPNRLTVAGFLFTLVGCAFLVASAGHALPVDGFAPAGVPRSGWVFVAFLWFLLAAACDMLDGAVARCGRLHSDFGAILDSSLDRLSDVAIWTACALYFAAGANVTYCLLAILAMSHAFLVSYVKARAEDIIPDCTVGYWQRGERMAAILIGTLVGHMPAVIVQQGTLPLLTVWRRLRYAAAVLHAKAHGTAPPVKAVPNDWRRWVMAWRYPRGSVGYDLVTGLNILYIVAGPILVPWLYRGADPLGEALRVLNFW